MSDLQERLERIYLAPLCCTDPDEGRIWCGHDVWPLDDCPNAAGGVPYVHASKVEQLEAEVKRLNERLATIHRRASEHPDDDHADLKRNMRHIRALSEKRE
jgi:hypothetical protein